MATLKATLKKLEKLGVEVKKTSYDVTNYYNFSINGNKYEFINQPVANGDIGCLCRLFGNGEKPSFYKSLSQLLRMAKAA